MSGYQNYTNSDFYLKIASASCTYGLWAGSASSIDEKTFYLSPSISYDGNTGIITVSGCTKTGYASADRVRATVTLTVEVWVK